MPFPSKITSRQEAKEYYEKHHIYTLLEQISSDLAVHQPPDPRKYVYNMLGRMLGLEEQIDSDHIVAKTSSLRIYVECSTFHGHAYHQFRRSVPHLDCTVDLLHTWQREGVECISKVIGQAVGDVHTFEPATSDVPLLDHSDAQTKPGSSEIVSSPKLCVGCIGKEGMIESLKGQLNSLRQDFARVMMSQMSMIQETSLKSRKGERQVMELCFGRTASAIGASPLHTCRTPERVPELIETENSCSLRLIVVSDISELEFMSNLDSLVKENMAPVTINVLAGNFLAPAILSSLDMGKGMIDVMNSVGDHGIQIACLGNREAGIPIEELTSRVKEFKGSILNANIPQLQTDLNLPQYKIFEVEQGGQKRKIAFVGLLSLDKHLFENPKIAPFGGALATAKPLAPVFESVRTYLLEKEGCDVVIPITHQRLADDRAMIKTLKTDKANSNVPLIIGGHDSKPTVGHVDSCLIVKPGALGKNAAVIDITWPSLETVGSHPVVRARLLALSEYPNSQKVDQVIRRHQHVLDEAEGLFLFDVPPALAPLSSVGIQRQQTTVGTLLATRCRDALSCQAAIIDASAFLEEQQYPDAVGQFSYGDLRRQVPHNAEVCVVLIGGAILAAAVAHSRARVPKNCPGFLQLDDGMAWDDDAKQLTHVQGDPLDSVRVYRVAMLLASLNGTNRNQPLIDWANMHSSDIPHGSVAVPFKAAIVAMSRDAILRQAKGGDELSEEHAALIGRAQIRNSLAKIVGDDFPIPEFMVSNFMSLVDLDNNGLIDAREFNNFLRFAEQLESFKVAHSKCTLRIISVNDVYELANFPFLDGVIRSHMRPNTITTLPGDFLAPSLLSSLDKGRGMVDMLNRVGGVGIQYVCFGNHETDVPIDEMRRRIEEYKGVWLNTNMPDFKPELPDYKIVEVEAGGQRRRVGLIGLLTIDKNLYQPGAFGGGIDTALPVVETAMKYRKMLMEEEHCDLVIPLTHQVMAEDRAMARQRLGFPLLLAAHDHDPYVEQVEGCWIVKTGCDAVNAAIIDITWASHETPGDQPTVEVQVVKCRDYPENLDLTERVREHNRIVEQLEQAYLIDTPIGVHLVSAGIRRSESTLATFLCTLLRDGFRSSFMCDGVLIDAGAIRRNHTYPEHYTQFTYGDLKKEIPFDTEMVVVSLPGSVVAEAVRASRARAFLDPPEDWGGYMQLDEGFRWDAATNTVTHINGAPIEADREYHVAVLLLSLNGMNRNQPLIDWANANADKIPLEEAARKAKDVIVDRCSKEIIARLGDFHDIDMDGDGLLSMHEIMAAMSKFLKREVTEVEVSNFMEAMDKDKSGSLSREEFQHAIQAIKHRL